MRDWLAGSLRVGPVAKTLLERNQKGNPNNGQQQIKSKQAALLSEHGRRPSTTPAAPPSAAATSGGGRPHRAILYRPLIPSAPP